jgi:uncharacterized cofD-like protein
MDRQPQNLNRQRVVVLGGGTGTHMLLRGLRRYADIFDITAIVSMADSGGSTGRLRDEFGQLPVGDVRNALTALAMTGDTRGQLLRDLFLYRFQKGEGLSGHNFGNLFLTALTDILGSEAAAITAAGTILRIAGTVIPVTTSSVHLVATYDDGVVVRGEALIDDPPPDRHHHHIQNLTLTGPAPAYDEALAAIAEAALIVVSPGDLYTSLIPVVLPEGVSAALRTAPAPVVAIGNLMSRPGQTVGMDAGDHVREWARYAGRLPDVLLAHDGEIPEVLLAPYVAEHEHPIALRGVDAGVRLLTTDLLWRPTAAEMALPQKHLVRHDSDKVAAALVSLNLLS